MKKAVIITVISLIVVFLIVLIGVLVINNTPDNNVKKITVVVTNADGKTETLESFSDASYAADALKDIGVIGLKNDDGVYDTVNYTKAEENGKWGFYKGGKEISDIDKCLFKDGDIIEIKYEETKDENK